MSGVHGQRLLLTGATGFLGSHVARALVREGHALTLLVRPTSSFVRLRELEGRFESAPVDALDEVVARGRFDAVVHLATAYGRRGETEEELERTNVRFPTALLEAALRHGVPRFVNTHTSLPGETSAYARSKHAFRAALLDASARIEVVELVPECVIGPGDDEDKLVPWVFANLAAGVPSLELTHGHQRRDVVDVEDAARAFARVVGHAPRGAAPSSYPLGRGEAIAIRELVARCGRIAGNRRTRFEFGRRPERPGESTMTACDPSALHALGWRAEVPLDESLRRAWGRRTAPP